MTRPWRSEVLAKSISCIISGSVCAVDSTDIDDRFVLDKLDGQKVRLFSIDGGHTVEHTINDLRIAEACVTNGGIVFVDDYCNVNWPGVTEGLVRYMLFRDERPRPEPVRGASSFAETFAARGPRDAKGRSLREFELQTRLFRYPLSYMIYSDLFDALPELQNAL